MSKTFYEIPLDGELFSGKLKNTMKILPRMDNILEEQLENQLVQIGRVIDPIIICKSLNNPALFEILSGEVEYDIALRNNLPFMVVIMNFTSTTEVIQFIISKNLLRLHLNRYLRGSLVLKHESKLIDLGRKNMSMGGKGINKSKNLQPHNTNKILADMADCSTYLLDQIKKINAVLYGDALKFRDMRKQLEADEMTVNKAFELLFPKEVKKLAPAPYTTPMPYDVNSESITPALTIDTKVQNELVVYKPTIASKMKGDPEIPMPFIADEVEEDSDNEVVTVPGPVSKYDINTDKEYQVVYIRPKWNLTDQILLHDNFLDDLTGMNVSNLSYSKFATLFILAPAKYLSQTIEIAQNWGFSYADMISVKMKKRGYISNYANQITEYLIVFEKNKAAAPNLCKKHLIDSEISENLIFNIIEDKFPAGVNKIGIFTEAQQEWDTYDFDGVLNKMVSTSAPVPVVTPSTNVANTPKNIMPVSLTAKWVTSCIKEPHRNQMEYNMSNCPRENELMRGTGDLHLLSHNGLVINNDVLIAMRKYIKDDSIDLIITSPPYNLGYQHSGNRKTGCYPDNMPEDEYQYWQKEVLDECYRVLKPDGSMLYNHKNRFDNVMITPYSWINKTDFILQQEIIWINGTGNVDKRRLYPSTERVYHLSKSLKTKFINNINKTDVFGRKNWKPSGTMYTHTNMFPIMLPTDLIECFPDAKIILDPFAGKGTVSIAAEYADKQWISIEKDLNFCMGNFNLMEYAKEDKAEMKLMDLTA